MKPTLIQVQTDSREMPRLSTTVDDAMKHVLVVMGRDRAHGSVDLDRLVRTVLDTYAYLGAARPNLAHVVFKEAEERRDPALVVLHDVEAQAGEDSVRLVSVLRDERAPSIALMLAMVDVVGWGNDPEAASEEMVGEIASMAMARPGHSHDDILRRMRQWQDAFGHPEGHPLRIVPAPTPGETALEVLRSIPDIAARRLHEVAASVEPLMAPRR